MDATRRVLLLAALILGSQVGWPPLAVADDGGKKPDEEAVASPPRDAVPGDLASWIGQGWVMWSLLGSLFLTTLAFAALYVRARRELNRRLMAGPENDAGPSPPS